MFTCYFPTTMISWTFFGATSLRTIGFNEALVQEYRIHLQSAEIAFGGSFANFGDFHFGTSLWEIITVLSWLVVKK